MENLYFKMYDEPELVDAVFDHIMDYYITVNQQIFDAAADVIDIFFIGNDFGSQNGPLLGLRQFERFILPPPPPTDRTWTCLWIAGAIALLRRI